MAKITKRMKKDGSCSYCIRVSNGLRDIKTPIVQRVTSHGPGMTTTKLILPKLLSGATVPPSSIQTIAGVTFGA